jgi:hypothetical protein
VSRYREAAEGWVDFEILHRPSPPGVVTSSTDSVGHQSAQRVLPLEEIVDRFTVLGRREGLHG